MRGKEKVQSKMPITVGSPNNPFWIEYYDLKFKKNSQNLYQIRISLNRLDPYFDLTMKALIEILFDACEKGIIPSFCVFNFDLFDRSSVSKQDLSLPRNLCLPISIALHNDDKNTQLLLKLLSKLTGFLINNQIPNGSYADIHHTDIFLGKHFIFRQRSTQATKEYISSQDPKAMKVFMEGSNSNYYEILKAHIDTLYEAKAASPSFFQKIKCCIPCYPDHSQPKAIPLIPK